MESINNSICSEYLTSLVGGNTSAEGNVFIDGGPVCDYGWGWKDAQVVCRSQGYNFTFKPVGNSHFGLVPDNFINVLGYVSCNGEESYLKDCSFGNVKCPANRGAGVICTNTAPGGLYCIFFHLISHFSWQYYSGWWN